MWHRRATQPERKQQQICISDNIYIRHVKDIYIYMCMYFIYSTAIASWRAGNQKLVAQATTTITNEKLAKTMDNKETKYLAYKSHKPTKGKAKRQTGRDCWAAPIRKNKFSACCHNLGESAKHNHKHTHTSKHTHTHPLTQTDTQAIAYSLLAA